MPSIAPMVTVDLDKPRKLCLDLNGMILYEQETGKSLLEIPNPWVPTLVEIRAVLWVFLLHDDPDLTLEQAGAMIHTGNLRAITVALGEAFRAAMPVAKEGSKPAKNPKRSTG